MLPRTTWNLLDPDVLAWHTPERLPPDFADQLVELRRVIEPAAAEFAARRGTAEKVEAIGAALGEMHRHVENLPDFIRADLDFHIAIFVASGNVLFDRLGRICEPLLGVSFELRLTNHDARQIRAVTLPRHEAIYNAILARDPAAAAGTKWRCCSTGPAEAVQAPSRTRATVPVVL